MTRTVYVNGSFVAEDEACISIFDRGFLFADAVYEVTSVLDGRLIDFAGHMKRLARSLRELSMPAPADEAALLEIHRELVRLNDVVEGLVYLQVSRGAAERDFAWGVDMQPSLVMFTQSKPLIANPLAATGVRVITWPDQRWGRRDIKTVQLLYSSLAKMAAKEQGCGDAWLVEDGLVTEGTSNNAWIVTRDGVLVTRGLSHDILHGITRAAVMRLAGEAQIKVEERPFTVAEAQEAAEAFSTSASAFVMPVVAIDGVELGDGKPGPVARRLREIYVEESRRAAV
ncbi:MAG: D-amino-acid transaminase [Alphaproteobacteria bacterium]|nr:MAG: D-amino-acid transaminase [Alphaproteobacteria bacterium]